MKYTYILWLIASALTFSVGEYFSKKFSIEPRVSTVGYLLLFYLIGTILWLPAIYQRQSLSITGTIWSVLTMMMTVILGTVIFKESVSTTGMIGIALSIVSVILLSL